MSMYEQFKTLQEGDKITIIGFNDLGFLQSTQTTFHSVKPKPHYQNCPDSMYGVELIHKPKRKRSHYKKNISYNSELVIFEGWKDINTDKENFKDIGNGLRMTEYTCFDDQYLKDIINNNQVKPLLTINL